MYVKKNSNLDPATRYIVATSKKKVWKQEVKRVTCNWWWWWRWGGGGVGEGILLSPPPLPPNILFPILLINYGLSESCITKEADYKLDLPLEVTPHLLLHLKVLAWGFGTIWITWTTKKRERKKHVSLFNNYSVHFKYCRQKIYLTVYMYKLYLWCRSARRELPFFKLCNFIY